MGGSLPRFLERIYGFGRILWASCLPPFPLWRVFVSLVNSIEGARVSRLTLSADCPWRLGLKYEVLHRPAYALAELTMETGESIHAEPGAMISMSDGIRLSTGVRGGIVQGLRRKVFGGESFFVSRFEAEQPGELTLGPPLSGDVEPLELHEETVLVQSGSFLAATDGIRVDSQWGGSKMFFTREGLYMLRCSGTGLMLLSSYGAIHRVDLLPGQRYTVDNGHMVAFDESVRYTVGKAGSMISSVLSGEGLVCKLEGPGRFFLQTRSEDAFLNWLTPIIKKG